MKRNIRELPIQNIPLRTELGRQLSELFKPKEYIDVDWASIELRILASMQKDKQ